MSKRPYSSSIEVVRAAIGDMAGLNILDIGCGIGEECRAFVKLGARATGIDPNRKAIEQAREKGGGADYIIGTTENAGLESRSFDLVYFGYSLHHIPDMAGALDDTLKLIKPGGRIVILEPQADDPLYPVIRWLDDEKEVYQLAQRAIDAVVSGKKAKRLETRLFATRYAYASTEKIVEHMLQVDPERKFSKETIEKVEKAFKKAICHDKDGPYIDHWYRMDMLGVE